MKRDGLLQALAGLLAVLALPSAGWFQVPLLPATPWAYLPIALGLSSIAWLGASVYGVGRVLVLCVATLPFLAYGVLAAPGSHALDLRWLAVLGGALFVSLLPQALRLRALGVVVAVLLGGSILGAAGLAVVPRASTPLLAPPASSVPAPFVRPGVRAGAPVRASDDDPILALTSGSDTWWGMATQAAREGPRPHVLVLDGTLRLDPSWRLQTMTVWGSEDAQLEDRFDLDAFDAVLVTDDAWSPIDPKADAMARAVSDYVRGGGLLLGPGPEHGWPEGLGRHLGSAGSSSITGTEGKRGLGLGKVVRAATREEALRVLLEDHLWVRNETTVFHGGRRPGQLPPALGRWEDDPAPRRAAGGLLLLCALALVVFQRLLTGGAQRVGVGLVTASALCALLWIVPKGAPLHAAGVRFDLGGLHGRRVEALWLSAGPTGYTGRIQWQGGGYLRMLGGRVQADGRVQLAPGATAWILRDSVVRAPPSEDRESRQAAFVMGMLEGDVPPPRMRLGRGPRLPVAIEGLPPVEAWTLQLRPGGS